MTILEVAIMVIIGFIFGAMVALIAVLMENMPDLGLTPLDHFFITITLTNLALGTLVWRLSRIGKSNKQDKQDKQDKDSK